MRAHLINEKFDDQTDPIADMGIGGVNLDYVFEEIMDKAGKNWLRYLDNNLTGRTVTGKMHKWGNRGHEWKTQTIKVKEVKGRKNQREVNLLDNNGEMYTIGSDEKIYISE